MAEESQVIQAGQDNPEPSKDEQAEGQDVDNQVRTCTRVYFASSRIKSHPVNFLS